jgi:hypothetical protein
MRRMQIGRTLDGRVRHEVGDPANGDTQFVEIDAGELSGMVAAPT